MADRRPTLALLAGALLSTSCAGEYPPPPATRVETVVDVLHGVQIDDDYRWLEDQDSEETRAWIAAQNAYAERIVGESPARAWFRDRLTALMDRDDVGSTRPGGDFEYFTMRRAGEEMPVLYRRPRPEGDDPDEPTVEGAYEIVLDPADFDPTYRTPISLMGFADEGRLMMYSVRQGGADEIEVRIRDLETGADLPDRLPNALYGGVEWDDEGTGFYYTHRSRQIGPRIRHHRLGDDLTADQTLWGEGYEPTAFIGMDRVEDDRWRIFTAQHGWARNEIHVQDMRTGARTDATAGLDAHFQHRYRDGRIWILTDWDAPMYRLMVADPARPQAAHWEEVLPESDGVLQSYTFIDDRIYATYLHEVEDRVRVFEMDGTAAGDLPVPERSSVGIRPGDDGKAVLSVGGYLRPGTELEVDLASGAREVIEPPEVEWDSEPYEVTKLWFTSTGGATAPVHVLHRRGLELDGSHPTILNGYGGFNVAIEPGFSAVRAAWLDAGGVYAVATLRGGSEFGEAWHRGGMLENKQRVFEDFIAAAEALVEHGYTSPERLGISGGSNGGLLVASAMTMRPDLFRAVLCTYPDLDMVRFWAFDFANNAPALLEYGDARIPAQFEAIRRYSPYQNVRDRVDYPAVMLATGDLDTRVPPLQARKLTARLQAASGSGLPVILRYDERGGHAAGRGRPMSLTIEENARELAFMADQLGLVLPPG